MSKQDKIPFVDLAAQYRRHKSELDPALMSVVESCAFVGGPALDRFEKAFAAYCGVKHAVGVGNGTDALALTLRAVGVGPGDEVIVPAHTFIATSEAVSMAGGKVVFVDVDERSSLMDPEATERAITSKTKALLPVHLYGQLAPMTELREIAQRKGVVLLEDAAQAHGARTALGRAGSLAQAAGFSFYPGKNLGAWGDGGAVTTNDDQLADTVRRLANHGRSDKYLHGLEGVNSRLDGMQAAVLEKKLAHLDDWNRARRAAAKRYTEALSGLEGVLLPHVVEEEAHVFHLYVIRVRDREGLRAHLEGLGIASGVHYPLPLHLQPAYGHLGYQKGAFPRAERFCEEIISLPMFAEITPEQQLRVVDAVRGFVGGAA